MALRKSARIVGQFGIAALLLWNSAGALAEGSADADVAEALQPAPALSRVEAHPLAAVVQHFTSPLIAQYSARAQQWPTPALAAASSATAQAAERLAVNIVPAISLASGGADFSASASVPSISSLLNAPISNTLSLVKVRSTATTGSAAGADKPQLH